MSRLHEPELGNWQTGECSVHVVAMGMGESYLEHTGQFLLGLFDQRQCVVTEVHLEMSRASPYGEVMK